MRKIFSLIAAVLFAGSMMASVITLDPADQTPQTTETDISLTIDGIDIAYHGTLNAAGANTPADFRVYANYSLTLSAEYNITKVVIAGKAQKANFTASVDHGTITTGASYSDVTEKKELSDPLVVIEDINSTSVILSVTKQLRAYLIEITIDDPTTRKITLVTGPWKVDDAQFAAATLNEVIENPVMSHLATATFSDFFVEESEGVFVGEVPYETKMIAFGRFSPNASAPISALTLMGTDFWNHSDILLLDESQKYTIISMGEGLNVSAKGYWGDDEVSYFLTGTFNNWATGDVNYLFKENLAAEGEWRLNTNIEKGAGVKVVGVHSKYNQPDWYPDGTGNEFVANNVYGDVTVYFRPDGQGGEEWHEGFFRVVPQEEEQEIEIIADNLIYDDFCAEDGWWQMFGKNAEYHISLSNLNRDEAAGTYEMDDLDDEYSYLVAKASPNDTIHFVSGSIKLEPDGEQASITGTLVGNDGISYKFNLKSAAAKEETLSFTDGEFDDTYLEDYYMFLVMGRDENYSVCFAIFNEDKVHEGEYTEYDLDDYTGIITPDGERHDIISADIKIETEGECTIVRADALYENNVLYHITMKIGDCPEEQKDYYEVAEAIAAVGAQEIVDDDVIAVRGIISKIQIKGKNFDKYHSACIYVSDATGAEGEFEFFNCVSLDDAIFASCDPAHDNTSTNWVNLNSLTDANGIVVAVGDEVIAQGKFLLYKNSNTGAIIAYELAQGCKLIKIRDISEGIEDIVATGAAAKVLRDNQILILKGDKVYNVFGTRVQ